MAKEKLLLLGGGGFLGTNIIQRFSNKYDIIAIDRGRYFDEIKPHLPDNTTFIKKDLNDISFLKKYLPDVSLIIHCTGPSRPKLDNDPNGEYWDHTLQLSRFLAEAAQKISSIKKIVYFSSYFVYEKIVEGKSGFLEDLPLSCDNIYGKCHLANEEIIKEHTDKYQIFRLSTVYGPYGLIKKNQTGGVLGFFIKEALNKHEIMIHGQGKQVMDFLYISDFLDLFQHMLCAPGHLKKTFNIGFGRETSVAELADTLKDLLWKKLELNIEIKKSVANNKPANVRNCIKKINQEFGISPKIPHEEGLWKTISLFMSYEKSSFL